MSPFTRWRNAASIWKSLDLLISLAVACNIESGDPGLNSYFRPPGNRKPGGKAAGGRGPLYCDEIGPSCFFAG
ncbi:hypothetical protein F5880DRAFT_1560968 [Lentinula raphanica]|nr:hypothetical protein F5880DRAFT_1560968 [Lentinula raphanica]